MILVTRDTARGLIVNMSDVLFDFNQATLKPGAKEKLAKVSGILLAYPSLHLSVEGHTDSIGTDDYNQKLSERRADAVKAELIKDGVAADAIETAGVGKSGLLVPTPDGVREPQNRRAEIELQ